MDDDQAFDINGAESTGHDSTRCTGVRAVYMVHPASSETIRLRYKSKRLLAFLTSFIAIGLGGCTI
jgi:hypothetical protein